MAPPPVAPPTQPVPTAPPAPAGGADHAVLARSMVKRYALKGGGEKRALDGLDLAVRRGTVHGLLGPNGAGKTTAVRALTTLIRFDSGAAVVAGTDVRRDPRGVRRRIGLAGQYAAVDELLTGRQNLEMFGRLFHLGGARARRRAAELLASFDLEAAADQGVSGYSGGMRRRLDLAASMILAPDVLFLDEPTTGLDPRGRGEVWDAVRALVADGTTVLLTTQYLDEADKLASRVTVIDRGRAIADDTPDGLKRTVGGERLEAVAAEPSGLAAVAEALARATGATPHTDHADRRVHAPVGPGTDGVAALTGAARALQESGTAIEDIGLRRPSLDDVFLRLTGRGAAEADRRRPDHSLRREGAAPMTTTATPAAPATPADRPAPVDLTVTDDRHSRLYWAAADTWNVVRRSLTHFTRRPSFILWQLGFPIVSVLLYGYVFGGAMKPPGGGGSADYRDFLMPGMFVMTMAMGFMNTATGVVTDTTKGVVDRFRSMPMAPSAFVNGRGVTDVIIAAAELTILLLTALAMGWRSDGGLLAFLGAVGLLLWLRFALIWIGVWLGLLMPSPEAAGGLYWRGLPAHHGLQRLRGALDHARLARRRRRLEPDLLHRERHPGTLRQPGRRGRHLDQPERPTDGLRLAAGHHGGLPAAGGAAVPAAQPLSGKCVRRGGRLPRVRVSPLQRSLPGRPVRPTRGEP